MYMTVDFLVSDKARKKTKRTDQAIFSTALTKNELHKYIKQCRGGTIKQRKCLSEIHKLIQGINTKYNSANRKSEALYTWVLQQFFFVPQSSGQGLEQNKIQYK